MDGSVEQSWTTELDFGVDVLHIRKEVLLHERHKQHFYHRHQLLSQGQITMCPESGLETLVRDYEDKTQSQSQCHRGRSECNVLPLGSLVRALNSACRLEWDPAVVSSKDTIDVLVYSLDNVRVTSYCDPIGDCDDPWAIRILSG